MQTVVAGAIYFATKLQDRRLLNMQTLAWLGQAWEERTRRREKSQQEQGRDPGGVCPALSSQDQAHGILPIFRIRTPLWPSRYT